MKLNILDLLIIYLLPIILVFIVCLLFLLFLFFLIILPSSNFNFKYDLLVAFESQKNLQRLKNRKFKFFRFYVKTMLGDSGTQAILFYRMSHVFLIHKMGLIADFLHRFSKFATGTDISPFAEIGKGFRIFHGIGTVIGKGTVIGENCLVCQGVTTGHGHTKIGNGVILWAGAKVLGSLKVGDNSEVGANSVVTKSIPSNTIALGVPAIKIVKRKIDQAL